MVLHTEIRVMVPLTCDCLCCDQRRSQGVEDKGAMPPMKTECPGTGIGTV